MSQLEWLRLFERPIRPPSPVLPTRVVHVSNQEDDSLLPIIIKTPLIESCNGGDAISCQCGCFLSEEYTHFGVGCYDLVEEYYTHYFCSECNMIFSMSDFASKPDCDGAYYYKIATKTTKNCDLKMLREKYDDEALIEYLKGVNVVETVDSSTFTELKDKSYTLFEGNRYWTLGSTNYK